MNRTELRGQRAAKIIGAVGAIVFMVSTFLLWFSDTDLAHLLLSIMSALAAWGLSVVWMIWWLGGFDDNAAPDEDKARLTAFVEEAAAILAASPREKVSGGTEEIGSHWGEYRAAWWTRRTGWLTDYHEFARHKRLAGRDGGET